MLPTAAGLAVLATVLAWPVPLALARAAWPARAPAAALAAWQAVALAGVLSLLGALLTAGLAPFGPHLVAGAQHFAALLGAGGGAPAGSLPGILCVWTAVLLGAHLAANLGTVVVRTERQRRRHLDLLLLLSDPIDERPATRLLSTPAPVAYCLPGTRSSVTVLSDGLLELLDEQPLAAVVAHERAHVRQHHLAVLSAFRAWRAAFPWFPVAVVAEQAVGMLIEMTADDQARAASGDVALAAAIAAVGGADLGVPTADRAPAADADFVAARIERLVAPPLPAWRRTAIVAGSVALIVVPAVVLAVPALP